MAPVPWVRCLRFSSRVRESATNTTTANCKLVLLGMMNLLGLCSARSAKNLYRKAAQTLPEAACTTLLVRPVSICSPTENGVGRHIGSKVGPYLVLLLPFSRLGHYITSSGHIGPRYTEEVAVIARTTPFLSVGQRMKELNDLAAVWRASRRSYRGTCTKKIFGDQPLCAAVPQS